MATRSLGTLTLDLVAKIGGYVDGLTKAERETKRKSEQMSREFEKLKSAFLGFTAAAVAASAALVTSTVQAAGEITNLSSVAGVGVEEFQRYAAGARFLGIEQEKLADIFKDTSDKVGDFLQTGGGPLADFFENIAPKVGVTAEQFRNLSGPQALELYVASLEKANVSQNEMVFFLEAIASDATLLLPLLRNGAEGFDTIGQAAADAGAILDKEAIQKANELRASFFLLETSAQGLRNQIATELVPVANEMSALFLDIAANSDLASIAAEAFGTVLRGVVVAGIAVGTTLANVGRAIGGLTAAAVEAAQGNFDAAGSIIDAFTADNIAATEAAEERINKLFSGEFREAGERAASIAALLQRPTQNLNGQFRATSEEAKKAGDAIAKAFETLEFQVATLGMTADETERYRLKLLGATEAELAHIETLQERIAFDEELDERIKLEAEAQEELNKKLEDYQGLIDGTTDAQQTYAQQIEDLTELLEAGKISQEEFNEAVGRAKENFEDAEEGIQSFAEFARVAGEEAKDAFADFLFDPFENGVEGMVRQFADAMRRIAVEAAAQAVFDDFANLFDTGDGSGIFGEFLGNFFGGNRENGGPVFPGQFFEVGEGNKPELLNINNRSFLIPGNRGNVEPIRESGNSVMQVFNIQTPDVEGFRANQRQISREQKRGFKE